MLNPKIRVIFSLFLDLSFRIMKIPEAFDNWTVMAAVDQFSFLLKHITDAVGHGRDAFALIGSLYVSRKTLLYLLKIYNVFNDHLFSKLSRWSDLKFRFGKWAGYLLYWVSVLYCIWRQVLMHYRLLFIQSPSKYCNQQIA